jgi:Sigma-54 interaction domain
MGAYIGANKRFGSGDLDHQRRFEHVISYSAALESAYREIAELKDKLSQKKLYLEDEIRGELDFEGIVGRSSALRRVLNLVETVAPSDSTVLLLGETGTGVSGGERWDHSGGPVWRLAFPSRTMISKRSSPSRVRFAAQHRRALDRSGPF